MKAGAASALAADIDRYALVAIALNAEANGVRVETTDADLLAGRARRVRRCAGRRYVLRARPGRAGPGLHRGRRATRGAEVLVGDPRRSYFPKERFRQVAEYSVPVTRDLEDMEIKHTAVWRLA